MLHITLAVLTTRAGPTFGLTFQEVTATADVYSFSMELYVQYSPDTENVTFPKPIWIDRDEYLELRSLGRITINKIPSSSLPQIPVVCGNLQCGIFAKKRSDQIKKFKRSPLGTVAACLYNAVRNEGYLDLQWQDMELLIENYDSAEIFDGQPPKDAKEYYKHFSMSIDSHYFKKSGEKRESQVSEIVKTFEKLLCQTDSSKTETSIDLVEEFLHQTAQLQDIGHLQGMGKKYHDDLRDHWKTNLTLHPTQLLTFLEERLIENEPMLDFDYYAFYKSCFLLLRLVEAELRDELNTFLSNLPIASRDDLDEDFRWMSTMVLLDFQYTLTDGPPPEKMLVRVAGVFKKFLERYPDQPNGRINQYLEDDGVKNGMCIHWGSCKWLGTRHSGLKFG